MDFWNNKILKEPPKLTIEYNYDEMHKIQLTSSLQKLLKSLQIGLGDLSDEDVIKSFQLETALLKSIILQNIRHRTEKFYMVLKKVEKTCQRWKEIDINKVLNDVLQLMPDISSQARLLRIPSRQMFEYLLCRILGGVHLLLALDGYCLESASYLITKISSGHFFATAMVFLATVARIRVQSLYFAVRLAKLYDAIIDLVLELKGSTINWMPCEVILPHSLLATIRQHCEEQNIHKLEQREKEKIKESKEVASVLSLFKRDMDKCPEDQVLLENKMDIEENNTTITLFGGLEEDLGEFCSVIDLKKDVKKTKIASSSKRKYVVDKENDHGKYLVFHKENVNDKKKKDRTINKEAKKKLKTHKKLPDSVSLIVTNKFAKNYKKVTKCLKSVNSFEDLNKFLIAEKKRRSQKCPSRVSSRLKKQDWLDFCRLLKNRTKKYHKLKKAVSGSVQIDNNDLLKKSKNKMKYWLLFPKLKGKKPHNWQVVVSEVKNKKL